MTGNSTIVLRPSRAMTWLQCPPKAGWQAMQPREAVNSYQSVAAVYGSLVHHHITGHVLDADDRRPIAFDNITRNQRELDIQVADAVDYIRDELAGETCIASEEYLTATASFPGLDIKVNGTVDRFIRVGSDKIGLRDLKTGRAAGFGDRPQMAIYTWLCHHNDIPIEDVALIRAPRGENDPFGNQLVEMVPLPTPAELIPWADRILRHVAFSYEVPVEMPGFHCNDCGNTGCPVFPKDGAK